MKRVIIDTDPGMDDSVALMLALENPKLKVEALTTVAGNYPIEVTTTNALKILELTGDIGIPVYKGAGKPLNRELAPDPFTHGKDGQGENNLPEPKIDIRDTPASEAIAQIVNDNPGKITIITLGPLTNVAQAIIDFPEIKDKVKNMICLAGTFGLNQYSMENATGDNPHSEWNVYVDPEAAKIVLESGIDITCIGLDVSTHFDINFSNEELNEIHSSDGKKSKFMSKAIKFTMNRGFQSYTVLIDSMAIAYAIDPSLIKTVEGRVGVETKGELTLGMTLLDQRHSHVWEGLPVVKVAYEAEYKRFSKLVFDTMLD